MAKPILTHERLKHIFDYQPETGKFFRKECKFNPSFSGRPAGYKRASGYIRINVDGNAYYAHRLAWFYVYGHMPDLWIDHINGDKSDNRISNLRHATPATNNQNRKTCQRNSKTGVLGVDIHKATGKYRAQITIGGKKRNLGNFDSIAEAQAEYLRVKRETHLGCTI
jgi:hypothetical protein